jgi:glycosyltransferase involved in cell wall biosynthesis
LSFQLKVVFIFRKNNPVFFSIERIFASLAAELDRKGADIASFFVPDSGVSLNNVLKARTLAAKARTLAAKARTSTTKTNTPATRAITSVAGSNGPIYHVTGDIHYIVLGLPGRNTILTIHDCVFLYKRKGLKKWLLKKLFLDWPVRRCAMVTTISEATKRDILAHTRCRPEKITVIPNPVDEAVFYHRPAVFRQDCPVILFMGSTPNKNLGRVAQALDRVPCQLHIVGEIPAADIELLQQYKIQYTQSLRLSDEEIADAYASSDLLMFPSTFEGFGLPILEAQRTGRPVITSNISPMKEVAAEGARLVDPFSVDSIREGALAVIGNRQERERMVEAGLQNCKRYHPEYIADQYMACYQKLLAGPPFKA